MTVGLLFESRKDILSHRRRNIPADFLHHWREPEEVSALTKALSLLGHKVELIGPLSKLLSLTQNRIPWDLVWNLSVGVLSRNRTALAPALLETLGIPYLGADSTTKSIALNKEYLKPVAAHLNVPTPEWVALSSGEMLTTRPPWKHFVIKPSCEGYSIGLASFSRRSPLPLINKHLRSIWRHLGARVLVERLIDGREITISLIEGDPGYGAAEARRRDGRPLGRDLLDLSAKTGGGITRVPVSGNDRVLGQCLKAARGIMAELAPMGYASFDFRIAKNGKVYLIDVNADATLHPRRSFALGFQYNGISYLEMISRILAAGLKRWAEKPSSISKASLKRL